MKTKFWEFRQNNSGGYFIEDDEKGVCENVIIEAQTPDDAWDKLVQIGCKIDDFWEYCPCCRERWRNWIDEDDGKNVPMHYDTPVEKAVKSILDNRAFVHYYNGTIKEFKFKPAH